MVAQGILKNDTPVKCFWGVFSCRLPIIAHHFSGPKPIHNRFDLHEYEKVIHAFVKMVNKY